MPPQGSQERGDLLTDRPQHVRHDRQLRVEHGRDGLDLGARTSGPLGSTTHAIAERSEPFTRDPFPQAAHRTGSATLIASGSPRGHAVGVMAVAVQGEGIWLPRYR